eukprot:6491288-Amphidinium_carterae.3
MVARLAEPSHGLTRFVARHESSGSTHDDVDLTAAYKRTKLAESIDKAVKDANEEQLQSMSSKVTSCFQTSQSLLQSLMRRLAFRLAVC